VVRLDRLTEKVDTKIELLGALAAADGALRPCDACLIVRKNDCWASLRKTKISKKLAKINYFCTIEEAEMYSASAVDKATIGWL